jgi:tetratricopeptide (TPR) repeat protein
MGVVYAAYDTQLERTVAVKLVSEKPLDTESRQQLLAEARSASALNHPNICTVHEVGQNDGQTYIVMEHVAGRPLSATVPEGGLPPDTVLTYSIQIADALSHAHRHGIIHCDLKSANVVITPEGRAKVLDFGLARRIITPHLDAAARSTEHISSSSTIAGTLHYIAPEVLQGNAMDTRSDIWSLGVLLYEMTTGRLPFDGNTGFEVSAAILREAPAPMRLQVPAGLRAVILHCLSKEVGQRYQHASEVRAALEALRSQSDIPPRVAPSRHRPLLLIMAGILAVTALFALVPSLRQRLWEMISGQKPAATLPVQVRRSIAVLGFKSQLGRPEANWLSTALAGMLTTELAAGEKLRTISLEDVGRAKSELSLGEPESLARDTLARLRKNLGADLVLLGSYTALGEGQEDQIRLDLRVQDAKAGETLVSLSETGTTGTLFAMVSRAGADLRNKLGVGEVSVEEQAALQAGRPSTTEGARLYAEGLDRLQVFDFTAARGLLEKAVNTDPDYPMAHSALAVAWAGAGYDDRAREESKRAYDLSARLSREQRLAIEGRYWHDAHEWKRASDTYHQLWNLFPDNLDYGLSLAAAQTAGGVGQEALATIKSLRKLPAPQRDDPRIDYAEAMAAMSVGDFKRALAAATQAVNQANARGARLLAAKAHILQSRAFFNVGEPDKAKQSLEEAKPIFDAAKDPVGSAQALTGLGNVAYSKGDLNTARTMYEESLALYLKVGNRRSVATSFSNLANVLSDQGDYVRAMNMYDQALANSREIHDRGGEVMALNNIAGAHYRQGNLPLARKTFEETAAIAHQIGDKSSEAAAELNLGSVSLEQGSLPVAKQKKEAALAIYREIGDQSSIATALFDLGEIQHIQGDLVGATARHDEALHIAEQLGEKGTIAMNRLALAILYTEQDRAGDAEQSARQAAEEYRAESRPDDQASALLVLAQLYRDQGKLGDAQQEIAQANAIAEKSSDKSLRIHVATASALTQAASGHPEEAVASLRTTIASAQSLHLMANQFEARLALGQIEMKSGKPNSARAVLASLEKDAQAKGYVLMARKARAAANLAH